MADEKLTDAEMRLFCLGAALYGTSTEGSRIIATALDEMQRLRRSANQKKQSIKARRKKR